MSKRNVAFIKPDEPNFLKRMKEEIGYKEPDTIEAKVNRIFGLKRAKLSSETYNFRERQSITSVMTKMTRIIRKKKTKSLWWFN
jgi:hypothetical protein